MTILTSLTHGGVSVSEQVTVAIIALIGVFLTAAFALIGAVVAAVISAKQKATSDLVASLQEEVKRQDERITALEDELEEAHQQKRRAIDYAHELLRWIATGTPPPPPDWPADLRR